MIKVFAHVILFASASFLLVAKNLLRREAFLRHPSQLHPCFKSTLCLFYIPYYVCFSLTWLMCNLKKIKCAIVSMQFILPNAYNPVTTPIKI